MQDGRCQSPAKHGLTRTKATAVDDFTRQAACQQISCLAWLENAVGSGTTASHFR